MAITDPILSVLTPDDFKDYFESDFDYAIISDIKITRAFLEANSLINTSLFSDNDSLTIAFYYLSAHCIVSKYKASNAGLNSVGSNIINSKSVDNVSASYSIPEAYLQRPVFNSYAKTDYGLRYLEMVIPRLVGNVGSVLGTTQP